MPLPFCRKALTFALLLTGCSLAVVAQRNFVPGYVVTQARDSLVGQIDFRDWGVTPDRIVFRQANSEKISEYSAMDLRAFGVSEQRYETHTVHIFPYSRAPEQLTSEDEIGKPYDTTVFLQVVTSGKLTLWEDRTLGGTNYYFINGKDGKPEQLRVITRIMNDDGTIKFDQAATYRNQLMFLLQDCDAAVKRIKYTDYNVVSLDKLIFSYNNCGRDTVEKRRDRGRVQLYPIVGYASSKIRFTGDDPAAYQHFPASPSIAAGVGALFIVPRNRQQLSFVTDVIWQHFHSESGSAAANAYITESGHMEYSLLNIDVLFRYRYPTDGLRPFVEAGVDNAVALGINCTESYFDVIGNVKWSNPMLGGSLHQYQLGWVLGAGLSGKRWTIEGRYVAGPGISEASDVRTPTDSWYVLFSYAL